MPPPPVKEDAYQGRCAVAGAFPPGLRGTLYRAGPGLWEVGERQLRHTFDGFALIGTLRVTSGGAAGPAGDLEPEVFAHQRFVDNEPYRAARRGRLIVDKFASRRRFEGWGAWSQDRIRVRGVWANWAPSSACVLWTHWRPISGGFGALTPP